MNPYRFVPRTQMRPIAVGAQSNLSLHWFDNLKTEFMSKHSFVNANSQRKLRRRATPFCGTSFNGCRRLTTGAKVPPLLKHDRDNPREKRQKIAYIAQPEFASTQGGKKSRSTASRQHFSMQNWSRHAPEFSNSTAKPIHAMSMCRKTLVTSFSRRIKNEIIMRWPRGYLLTFPLFFHSLFLPFLSSSLFISFSLCLIPFRFGIPFIVRNQN